MAGVLATVLVAGSGRAFHLVAYTGAWPPWASTEIKILVPPGGTIPRCATINGIGTAPHARTIWIAQRGQGNTGYFDVTKADLDGPGRWHVTMDVGPPNAGGKAFDLFVFTLGSEASGVVASMRTGPDGSFGYLAELPEERPYVTVTRERNDTRTCHT